MGNLATFKGRELLNKLQQPKELGNRYYHKILSHFPSHDSQLQAYTRKSKSVEGQPAMAQHLWLKMEILIPFHHLEKPHEDRNIDIY